jgi:hypothetical protein
LAGADSSVGDDSEEKYRKMEYDAILSEAGERIRTFMFREFLQILMKILKQGVQSAEV